MEKKRTKNAKFEKQKVKYEEIWKKMIEFVRMEVVVELIELGV